MYSYFKYIDTRLHEGLKTTWTLFEQRRLLIPTIFFNLKRYFL